MTEPGKIINDLAKLRLDHVNGIGIERVLSTIQVRRPPKDDFIRVHPGADYCVPMAIYETREATYIVAKAFEEEFPSRTSHAMIYTAVTSQDVVFLWPVKMAKDGAEPTPWHESAAEAAYTAKTHWVRVFPNRAAEQYEFRKALNLTKEPDWSAVLPFDRLFDMAFPPDKRVIRGPEHPLVQKLLGA